LALRAASFQPLGLASAGSLYLDYPGLPAAHGVRLVNTFGGVRQDVYIPPQPAGYTFYLFASVANNGSRTVTVESVALPRYSALTPAGPVLYGRRGNRPGAPGIPPATRILRSVAIAPGDGLFVAIPVRSWPCSQRNSGFATVPDFLVTYRWLFFTHTVAIPWGEFNDEVIMHAPAGRPGEPGVICLPGTPRRP
jgi:hypothetical protein